MYEQQFNWLDRLRKILIVDNKQFVFIIMRKISIQNQGSTNIITWNSKKKKYLKLFFSLWECRSVPPLDKNTYLSSADQCEIALTAPYLPSLKIFATKRLANEGRRHSGRATHRSRTLNKPKPTWAHRATEDQRMEYISRKNLINWIVAWIGWVYRRQSDCQNERGGHMKNLHFWAMPEFMSSRHLFHTPQTLTHTHIAVLRVDGKYALCCKFKGHKHWK